MYKAIITKINVRPHPNADKLQLGNAAGFQVIVGLDTQDNDLGIFFPTDGQLSHEFCVANDLYPRFNENGTKIGGGFFDPKNRRVKAQGFRGEKSYGFWCPLSYLDYIQDPLTRELVEGTTLTEWTRADGELFQICNRYETEATLKAKAGIKKTKKVHLMFKEHFNTEQLKYYVNDIPAGSLITITEKLHGTSGRYGYVLEEWEPNWWQRAISWFERKNNIITQHADWTYLTGSRRVIINYSNGTSYYGTDQFRFEITKKLEGKLYKGETVYAELVGWVNQDTPIMPTVNTNALKDKAFTEQYGTYMSYKYGQLKGTCAPYIYRITLTNEDGYTIDYPWTLVKERAKELGLETVPELFPQFFYQGNANDLLNMADVFIDGPSTLDDSHIREGICLRIDKPNGEVNILKHKSFTFYVLEGVIKDTGAIDIEEAS